MNNKCLVKFIFEKYKWQTRDFAIQLLHQHFLLSKDEILHETNDKASRILLIKPIWKSELPIGPYPTAWSLNQNGKFDPVVCCCEGSDTSDAERINTFS
jgi:hypothetical protein